MEEIYFVHKCKYLVMLVVLSMFCSTAFAAEDGDVFRKIISVNDLQDGDEIIFVCSNGENQAMNSTWTSNTVQAPGSFRYSSLETTLGVHKYNNSNILVWKVERVGNGDNNFAFKVGSNYLSCQAANSTLFKLNSASASADLATSYVWNVTMNNGIAKIRNNWATQRYVEFNLTSGDISLYAESQSNCCHPCVYKNYKTDSPVRAQDKYNFSGTIQSGVTYHRNSMMTINVSNETQMVVNSYNPIYSVDLYFGNQDSQPDSRIMNGKTSSTIKFTGNVGLTSIVVRYGESRPVSAIGEIGTICLPYDVALGDIKGASCYETYYKEPVMDGETIVGYDVYFKEVTDSLKAGYPYIYQCKEETDVVSFGFSGDRVTEGRHKNGLYGTLDKHPFDSDQDYIENEFCVFKSGNLKYASSNSGVNAGRAYIRMSEIADEPDGNVGGNVKVLRLGMDDDNAIRVLRDENDFGNVYDLQGIRQQGQQKKRSGLYIVNGRKFLSR